jgi:hypothetical protein
MRRLESLSLTIGFPMPGSTQARLHALKFPQGSLAKRMPAAGATKPLKIQSICRVHQAFRKSSRTKSPTVGVFIEFIHRIDSES